jgi:hypothetical protein
MFFLSFFFSSCVCFVVLGDSFFGCICEKKERLKKGQQKEK